ncbi:hypothetical protein F5Y13DRAFT_180319 [Hypoxylon sp. FL1857]|nr:hypothetical protein F5Y13DRAFT_180319 [Hypoxylon sp. FL1857]
MGKLKPDIFQEFQERHFKCPRDFKSVDVQVIEVEGFEEKAPLPRSFIVKPDEIENWLTDVFLRDLRGDSSDTTGSHAKRGRKLRIILGYLGNGEKYDYMMQDQGLDVPPGVSVTTLPFSEQHYQLICERFNLPGITSLLLSREARALRGHFQLVKMLSENNSLVYGLVMSSFSSLLIGIKVGVSMSYDPSTGTTDAVLLASGLQEGFAWLHQDLEHLSAFADNPFLVPALVCQRLTEAIYNAVDNMFDRLHQVEIRSGQTGIMMFGENGMPMSRGNCEDPNLSIAVLGIAQKALAVEGYIRGHTITINSIKTEFLGFPWREIPSINYDRVKKQNEFIIKLLDFNRRVLDFAMLRVEHLKQRSNVQATAITNLLAQRNNETNRRLAESSTSIAHDTRRDSSAMKSIAILTMVFLPATFTATYFGTPAMAELKPSQSLYWVVTVPLTLAVVFVWLLSFYFWVATRFLPLHRANLR